nr:transmembrane protein 242-like isoform X2 [Procambarus clarkii]
MATGAPPPPAVGLSQHPDEAHSHSDNFKYKSAAFLIGVAGMSMLGGFGMTLGMAKKKDPDMFNKGIMGTREMREAGGALAMRALGRATLYAVGGVSVLCFGIWKLMGVKDVVVSINSLTDCMLVKDCYWGPMTHMTISR